MERVVQTLAQNPLATATYGALVWALQVVVDWFGIFGGALSTASDLVAFVGALMLAVGGYYTMRTKRLQYLSDLRKSKEVTP